MIRAFKYVIDHRDQSDHADHRLVVPDVLRVLHPSQRICNVFAPAWANFHCVDVGTRQIVGPVLGHRLNLKRRLLTVLRRLQAARTIAPSVGVMPPASRNQRLPTGADAPA